MASEDHQQKIVNKHRVLLVKNIEVQQFFDKMRTEGVLTLEDCQEMMAASLYPTDKQRASRFLDIVATKGPNGHDVFMQCLDGTYPHLYKAITGNEPTPRTHMTSPSTPFTYNSGCANLLQEVCEQKDKLQQEVNEKSLDIERLMQERDRISYQLGAQSTKLDNYQHLLIKHRKLDHELKGYKDELLDIYVSLKNTEKQLTKYRHMAKLNGQKANEYKEKLDKALELLNNHRQNWEKTHNKNEQLSQDKNNLQKEIQHIKMDLESTKRRSLYSLGRSFSADDTQELSSPAFANDTLMEILKEDKEQALKAYEEESTKLGEAQKEIYQKEMQVDKAAAENKDLKCMIEVIQMDLAVTERNYQLMWQEMQRVHTECNSALAQRNQAQAELEQTRQESLSRRKLLNDELRSFKKGLSQQYPDMPLIEIAATSTSNKGADSKSATFPRSTPPTMHQRPSLQPHARREVVTNQDSTESDDIEPISCEKTRPLVKRNPTPIPLQPADPFPETEIPMSPLSDEPVGDWKLILKDVFARKLEHTDSMDTHRGSLKKDDKHYEQVDFMLSHMQKSFRPRTRPDSFTTDFTLDYEEESREVQSLMEMDLNTTPEEAETDHYINHQDEMYEISPRESQTPSTQSNPHKIPQKYNPHKIKDTRSTPLQENSISSSGRQLMRQQALLSINTGATHERSKAPTSVVVDSLLDNTAAASSSQEVIYEDMEPPPLPLKQSEMKDCNGTEGSGAARLDNGICNGGVENGVDSEAENACTNGKKLSPNVNRNRRRARRSSNSPQPQVV